MIPGFRGEVGGDGTSKSNQGSRKVGGGRRLIGTGGGKVGGDGEALRVCRDGLADDQLNLGLGHGDWVEQGYPFAAKALGQLPVSKDPGIERKQINITGEGESWGRVGIRLRESIGLRLPEIALCGPQGRCRAV